MKKRYLVLVLILGFGVIFWLLVRDAAPTKLNTGNPSLAPESLPATKDDLIVVNAPLPHATVTTPLIIRGSARGNWYFEGSFPITLTNGQGAVLAQGHATAQGEWMTTDYVPFTASITYTSPGVPTPGFLILKKDNASGEPQFDNQLSIPVTLQ